MTPRLASYARRFLQFDLDAAFADVGPRYNIAPSQDVLAVRVPEPGAKRQLVALKWGLIPSWAKDAKIAYSTINARGDTVGTKPAFRSAFKKRRCLVLADGYYEWYATEQKTKAGKPLKQPFFIHPADGGRWMFAGLAESWRGPDGPVETFTIVTTGVMRIPASARLSIAIVFTSKRFVMWRWAFDSLLVPSNCR